MALTLTSVCSIAAAQPTGEGEKRGSIPIGTSQDGSGPSDGALIGGSTERLDASKAPQRTIDRCRELIGSLRDECLQDLGLNATSATLPVEAFEKLPLGDIYADPRRRRSSGSGR